MRTPHWIIAGILFWTLQSFPQTPTQAFAVASVKSSAQVLGKDRVPSRLVFQPDGVRGRNMTLKGMILEAYHLLPHQVVGAPDWLDRDEFEVDARSGDPASPEELRLMLQGLIRERFGFSFHRDTRQMNVYALIVDKGGPKIRPLPDSSEERPAVFPDFRGDLQDLADLIGAQFSIPSPGPSTDPTKPLVGGGPPAPVVDFTGLHGVYEIHLDLKPEATGDMFTSWQRFLQDRCGLRLENRKSPVPVLVVDSAARTPTPN
ncbi:MAG TPA: TIGR03435 family protein [Terriglobia bacterium]